MSDAIKNHNSSNINKVSSKKKHTRRPIPYHSLEESLNVTKAINDGNAGEPMNKVLLAQYLQISPSSSNFREITSSAFKYGLIDGTWNKEYIGLTSLGKNLVQPINKNDEFLDRIEALMSIKFFKDIFEKFKNKRIPSDQDSYFKNLLQKEYDVPQDLVEEAISLLNENGKFCNILRNINNSYHVVFDTPSNDSNIEITQDESSNDQDLELNQDENQVNTKATELEEHKSNTESLKKESSDKNKIFLIHGKDREPLEDLKKILNEFKIPHIAAIDEPNSGRPIPKKVMDLMNDCTSCIVLLTKDTKFKDDDDNDVYFPSDNAIYELGAASILYGNKIVILKEKDVFLASDFSDLGYISFEGSLSTNTMGLLKELVGIGILKVTPS